MDGSLLVSYSIIRIAADGAEEFVAAGDFLTFKFPVWQWCVLRGRARPGARQRP